MNFFCETQVTTDHDCDGIVILTVSPLKTLKRNIYHNPMNIYFSNILEICEYYKCIFISIIGGEGKW